MDFLNTLGKRIVYLDGGLGSLLQARGLKSGELPEIWNLTHPEKLKEIHREYIEAGADIISANTFGINEFKFDNVEELVEAGVRNAKEAVLESGKDVLVALDVGSCGKLLKPMGTLDFEDAVKAFARVIKAGKKAGADLVLIETQNDIYETKAIVLAAKENCDLPVVASVVFGENEKMLTGATPEIVVAVLEGLGVDVIGMNCGLGPKQMKKFSADMLKYASVPLVVTPNAGLPRVENGKTVYDVTPEEFAEEMAQIAKNGVWMLGGC